MGILSMQRVLNYGSFLQAYALKQLLLQNGADDVYFIDIEKGRSLAGFEQENSLLKKLFRAIVLLVQGQLPAKIRDMKFMVKLAKSLKSQWPELSLDEIKPNHFDVVFIGSDEVFNCCQKTTWGYTSQLYGHIPQADCIIRRLIWTYYIRVVEKATGRWGDWANDERKFICHFCS